MEYVKSSYRDACNVFYVGSWGHCGDHWLAKTLNMHPEIFALNSYEGVRAKYIRDGHDRGTRPNILEYTSFLEDMGTDFLAIGECHAYKTHELISVVKEYGERLPVVNLLRHPYSWTVFYIRHRANNMRMPEEDTAPFEFEWNCVRHDLYKDLGLKEYTMKDIHIWAFYQACLCLRGILMDNEAGVHNVRIEHLLEDTDNLQEFVGTLTHGKCQFSDMILNEAMRQARNVVFKGEEVFHDPVAEFARWPDWKVQAFDAILSEEAKNAYRNAGYVL